MQEIDIKYEYSTSDKKKHPYLLLDRTTVTYCPNPSTDVIINTEKTKNIDEVVEQIENTIFEQRTEQIKDTKPNKITINIYCEKKYQIPIVERLQK